MKRSLNIIKQELDFLDNLIKTRTLNNDKNEKHINQTLQHLAIKQALTQQELIQIILVNFKYSVIEASKELDLNFHFTKLTLTDICHFYFKFRLNDSVN